MSISLNNSEKGRGIWKMSNSFLEEENYIRGITDLIRQLKLDNQDADKVTFWEYLKFKIREFSAGYGKKRAKEKRDKEREHESSIKLLDEKIDSSLNDDERQTLENQKAEIEAKLKLIDDERTKGLLLRARCQWHEQGEKSNKYFLRQCSRNKTKSTINKLLREDNSETSLQAEILEMTGNYYRKLYSDNNEKSRNEKIQYLNTITMPKMSEEDKLNCEGELTIEELAKALKTCKKGKTPGNDGITVEFYQKFWPLLQLPLLESINVGYNRGMLSTSQRQAIITLLDKGKDRRNLKNWRPISLLNVDYKLGSKAIAERMKSKLSKLIHHNQVGYIEGRQITDNIRALEDIYLYTKFNDIPGIIINIDFEKAFDSVNWEFLRLTLAKLNFGESFIKWVETFYTEISSCVINNGTTSSYFNLERGVRQGDPLSPYLFLLVAEVLACAIRQNPDISGISVGNETINLLQFADDTSGILSDIKSAKAFLKTISRFGEFSGLRLNKLKTEAAWIGSFRHRTDKPLGITWPDEPMRFLGVFLSYNEDKCKRYNFVNRIDKCKAILNSWMERNLSLIGRAQVIKTFIISQFMYTLSAIEMPEDIISKLESMINNFIWRGKHPKIRASILKQPLHMGGLNLPDIRSMIKTNRIMWMKKFHHSEYHVWKAGFKTFLLDRNLDLSKLIFSNFSIRSLKEYKLDAGVPRFYIELLKSWSEIGQTSKKQNYLWYNKTIQINNRPIFYQSFHTEGINFISDLVDRSGTAKSFDQLGLDAKEWFNWYMLINSIKKNKLYSKEDSSADRNVLKVGGKILKTITSKFVYQHFVKNDIKEKSVVRIEKYVPIPNDATQDIFMYCHKNTVDTASKAFQYKFLYDILVNNYWLEKWRIEETNLCTFCQIEEETIKHLYLDCPFTSGFWRDVELWLGNFGVTGITKEKIFYGTTDKLLHTLVLLGKRFIHDCRIHKRTPILTNFKYQVKYLKNVEFGISAMKNNMEEYEQKWNRLNLFL